MFGFSLDEQMAGFCKAHQLAYDPVTDGNTYRLMLQNRGTDVVSIPKVFKRMEHYLERRYRKPHPFDPQLDHNDDISYAVQIAQNALDILNQMKKSRLKACYLSTYDAKRNKMTRKFYAIPVEEEFLVVNRRIPVPMQNLQ